MSLCILAAGKTLTLAVTAFTLSWTHSVEKTEWQERWAVTAEGLVLEEARVQLLARAGIVMPSDKVGVLAHVSCDFLKPLMYPAVAVVTNISADHLGLQGIDTLDELDYFKHGGILQYVIRQLLGN